MRLIPLLLLPLLLAACAAGERSVAPEAASVAHRDADAVVSVDRLAAQREMPGLVVLHVARERADYEAGHVPGARFLPFSAVAVSRGDQVNVLPPVEDLAAALRAASVRDGSRVVVYGDDLGGLAATRAFFALDVHGVDVAVLDGGLAAWRAAGHTVETGTPPAPGTGPLTLRLDRDLVLDADAVEARRGRADVLIVDARPPAQHTGAEPGEGIARPGHIPGSINRFWEEDRREDGRLRSLEELRARYAEAEGREMVVYCRTGVQASHAYFVGRVLGLRPRMYDGSFHDWSNNTRFPVATGP